jgi:hypothetical protein
MQRANHGQSFSRNPLVSGEYKAQTWITGDYFHR